MLNRSLLLHVAVRKSLQSQAQESGALSQGPADKLAAHVHALRKRTRQTRALVRLIGPALVSDRVVKRALRDLASASRLLSLARDAEMLPNALELLPLPLRMRTPLLTQTLLNQRALVAADPGSQLLMNQSAQAVQLATLAFAQQLPTTMAQKTILEGLRQCLHRVRACRKQADKHPRPEAFHDLRKACKDLRHQLEWLGVDREHVLYAELVQFVRALGSVTDLLALDIWLRKAGRACPGAEQAAVRKALDKSLARSTGKLIARCKALLPDKPRRMAASLLAELGW